MARTRSHWSIEVCTGRRAKQCGRAREQGRRARSASSSLWEAGERRTWARRVLGQQLAQRPGELLLCRPGIVKLSAGDAILQVFAEDLLGTPVRAGAIAAGRYRQPRTPQGPRSRSMHQCNGCAGWQCWVQIPRSAPAQRGGTAAQLHASYPIPSGEPAVNCRRSIWSHKTFGIEFIGNAPGVDVPSGCVKLVPPHPPQLSAVVPLSCRCQRPPRLLQAKLYLLNGEHGGWHRR